MTKIAQGVDQQITSPSPIQEVKLDIPLSSLPKETFEEIVNQDVRGSRGGLDEDTSKALREPENLDRWHTTLVSLKRNVDVQVTAKRAELSLRYAECFAEGKLLPPRDTPFNPQADDYLTAKAQTDHWRQGALRFKNGLEDRIAEAKLLREKVLAEADVRVLREERDLLLREIAKIHEGIIAHREAVLANPDDSELADEQLWRFVENPSVNV